MFDIYYLIKILPYLIFFNFPLKKKMYLPAWLTVSLATLLCIIFFFLYSVLKMRFGSTLPLSLVFSLIFMILSSGIFFCTLDVPFFTILFLVLLCRNYTDIIIMISRAASPLLSGVGHLSSVSFLQITIFILTLPFVYLLFTHFLVPIVDQSGHLFFWKYLWLLPGYYYVVYRITIDPFFLSGKQTELMSFGQLTVYWVVIVCISYFFLFQVMAETSRGAQLKEQLYFSGIMTQMQKEQYMMLQKNTEETRKNRHDLKQQLIVIKSWLEQGSTKQAMEYLSQCLEQYSVHTDRFCENYAVDSIIRYYADMARSQNIQIEISAVLPASMMLPELDFCTLLGNLMLNAVEACKRQTGDKKHIILHMAPSSSKILVVTLSNTYEGDIKVKNGAFLSSKRNSAGIGTMSAKHLAEKYGGTLNYSYNGKVFSVSLMFLIPDKISDK